ncbi:MAG: MFS transporter [Hamadaea sp.]|nr:MFS transporter [Hamadaea sp.]
MRTVLRRPAFRLLFAGLFFSMTAESVLLLALGIWVKDMTGSDSLAGATFFALVAPIVLAPFVGFFADRFKRRPFLIATNLFSAVILAPLYLVHDRGELWIIYSVAAAYGLSFIAVGAALNGLIKEVIPVEQLGEANGALQTVKQGLRLFAPLLGAGLYTAFGGWALATLGILGFLIAAGVITALRVQEDQPVRTEQRWMSEVTAGVRQLFGQPGLRLAVLGTTLAILVFGLGESVFFAFNDQGLHKPAAFLGVLISVQGVGGLLGGLTAAAVMRRFGEVGTVAAGLLLFVPMYFIGAVYQNVWAAFPAMVLCGFGLPYLIVGLQTLLQRTTPAELMGRTSAAMDALISGPQALSIGAGAILVGIVDYRILLGVMALVVSIAGIWVWAGRRLTPPAAATPSPAVDEPSLIALDQGSGSNLAP